MEAEFLKIQIDNFNLQLAIWGDKKETIFAIHGISSNSQVWREIAKNLSNKYKFIAIDLRGRGHSDSPGNYNLITHAKDIKKTLDKLNIDKTHIFGHSLGAYIAIIFAALYPEKVKKVILIDGGAKLSEKQAERVFNGIKLSLERLGKKFNSFEEYISHMKKAPFLSPWYKPLEEYYKYELNFLPDGKVISRVKKETIEEEANNLKNIDISKFYPEIKAPVLILRATNGMVTDNDHLISRENLEEMLEKIPDSRVIEIPETNHYTICFYPNKFRDEKILNFLNP